MSVQGILIDREAKARAQSFLVVYKSGRHSVCNNFFLNTRITTKIGTLVEWEFVNTQHKYFCKSISVLNAIDKLILLD